ncbi:MAG TPA: beta-propeller domain-containing protein [Kofleriaceae bacterium]|nr:beta-propeller domain-containing protein [Kofleriaceae bacterium]
MPRPIPSTLLVLLLPTFHAACSDSGDDQHRPWTAEKTVSLTRYQTCRELESDLKDRALEELDAIIDSYDQSGGALPPAVGGAEGDDASGGGDGGGAGSPRQEGTDYSGTNNQEEGVDEADLVKTDGYNLYVVNGNRLHVFGVPEFGQLVASSEVELEGQPYQLLLDSESGRAAVFSFVAVDTLPPEHPVRAAVTRGDATPEIPWRTWGLSKITVLDVSDPAAPALEREVWLEGWYQDARRIDSSVRVVANGNIMVPGLDDIWSLFYPTDGHPVDLDEVRDLAAQRIQDASFDDLIPRLYERLPSGELATLTIAGSDCSSFYRPTDSSGRTTTTIVSFDLAAPELAPDAETVVSNWATVYASRDRLYLAEAAWDWWWSWREVEPGEIFTPATNIHAFDVSQPGVANYVGSGRIDGTVVNQFALDEQDGRLRVAATTTPFLAWGGGGVVVDEPPPGGARTGATRAASEPPQPPPPESHIYVLEEQDGELTTVGHLGGIAVGESIFAARFLPTEAFVVTYQYVDPLFTIDLSDPANPHQVGELEVDGFSTYLHPIADDRILSIGIGGDENGITWNTQVSLFDVSDRAHPALVDGEQLTSDWSGWSEALYDHHAFQYFEPKKLLAVPISGYTVEDGPVEGGGGETPWPIWHSQLDLISVDSDSGLELRGTIDHSRFFESTPDGWWGGADIRRSIFMGDYIYALSSRAVTVHRLDDLSEVAAEELPLPSQPYWWW